MGYPLKASEVAEWEIPGFAGVELWSFMHDICHRLTPWRIPSFLYTWRGRVRGPDVGSVAHWDRMTQTKRFSAIGALDNHAITVPVVGTQILPYEEGFRTLRTHVFCEELSGEADDAEPVTGALAEGRAFMALDMIANARGFRFEEIPQGRTSGERLSIGDERVWTGPVRLGVRSPVEADLALLRNGATAARAEGKELEFLAAEPGVYRVEARLDGRPWVYTNPIYLRPPDWKANDGGGANL